MAMIAIVFEPHQSRRQCMTKQHTTNHPDNATRGAAPKKSGRIELVEEELKRVAGGVLKITMKNVTVSNVSLGGLAASPSSTGSTIPR
jgi:hypothetical protein